MSTASQFKIVGNEPEIFKSGIFRSWGSGVNFDHNFMSGQPEGHLPETLSTLSMRHCIPLNKNLIWNLSLETQSINLIHWMCVPAKLSLNWTLCFLVLMFPLARFLLIFPLARESHVKLPQFFHPPHFMTLLGAADNWDWIVLQVVELKLRTNLKQEENQRWCFVLVMLSCTKSLSITEAPNATAHFHSWRKIWACLDFRSAC